MLEFTTESEGVRSDLILDFEFWIEIKIPNLKSIDSLLPPWSGLNTLIQVIISCPHN